MHLSSMTVSLTIRRILTQGSHPRCSDKQEISKAGVVMAIRTRGSVADLLRWVPADRRNLQDLQRHGHVHGGDVAGGGAPLPANGLQPHAAANKAAVQVCAAGLASRLGPDDLPVSMGPCQAADRRAGPAAPVLQGTRPADSLTHPVHASGASSSGLQPQACPESDLACAKTALVHLM